MRAPSMVLCSLLCGCRPQGGAIPNATVPDLPRDAYRWLESPGPRRDAWVRARDAAARAALGKMPLQGELRAAIGRAASTQLTLAPARAGAQLFFLRDEASLSRPSLFVSDPAGARQRLLVSGAELAARGEALAIGAWPSPDGGKVAVCIGPAAANRCEGRILDAASGQLLPDRLPGLRRAAPLLVWDAAGSALAYAPAEGGRLLRRWLGASGEAVVLDLAGADATGLWRRGDDLVVALQRGDRSFATAVALAGGTARTLVPEGEGMLAYVGEDAGALFHTTRGAPRGRVVRASAAGAWEDIVPESKDVIETWGAAGAMVLPTGGGLYVVYRVGGLARLRRFDNRGGPIGEVPLPAGAIWSGLVGAPRDEEAYFVLTGFVSPGTVYRLEVASGTAAPLFAPVLPYDPGEIVTEARTYPSAAGRDAPVLLVRHRATRADGRRPVLLYGYGFGGWIAGPWFRPHLHEWLRRGGVFAVPAVRGGGELGEAWQRAGAGRNRVAGIDDFLAVRRWLVTSGWTSPGRIVAEGQSAGGPLVAGAVAREPAGFGALLLAHPVLDLLRYEQDPLAARRWRSEYGSVSDQGDLRALRTWAPLQRLRHGACYPPTLILPGERDPTAAPFHSYKYAAALGEAQGCGRPVLLRVAWGAGHAYGRDTEETVASYADQLAFALAMIQER